ncbi:GNAT family N-acetyltransferase [Rhodoferax sp. PAMC 29310]|uniref:GNAT family N-acetyltransferase n=1 Tax=Rhodoferax sp. PAMC 29310 TaxID=2822760 RepID=UPI001B32E296|nr:GNAT family N-acetyltransferase [Rhodoferax sp. PAMC 29310]
MKNSEARKSLRQSLRQLFSFLPRDARFAIYRSFVDCNPNPDPRLVLKIAETKEELEACFKLLHDAYVSSGFMRPDPSGMRVTIYHALPTTTTLCAKFDGEVVGTLSLIRESLFGFPLQTIFDLTPVRQLHGNLAEVSALAVHPKFRKTGGAILFPLMKFMYDYCTTFFDTRHLLIAVNPNRIEMYESLLFFQRLKENTVDNYDFANGAPAVGASLDLYKAPEVFEKTYGKKRFNKNLHNYFVKTVLPNIQVPSRRYFTTNDPVMTPDLLDYFFNQRTQVFRDLDTRRKSLLHAIYELKPYQHVLPPVPVAMTDQEMLRQHTRYSVKCPGTLTVQSSIIQESYDVVVTELSEFGFKAVSAMPLPVDTWCDASIQLGKTELSALKVMVVRGSEEGTGGVYGFKLAEPDLPWRKFVNAMSQGTTYDDLEYATRFLAT